MEYCDCTEYCKSKQHGDQITALLTKRGLTDLQICSYMNQLCYNCESVRDSLGRTALHVAISVGRKEVVQWLIRRKSNLNAKDWESSYTPLHRGIYYGNIHGVITLLQAGCTTNLFDNDGLTYIDHAVKNWPFNLKSNLVNSEVYIWGPDANYIFGAKQSRLTPEPWDIFHKDYGTGVQKMYLDKFHCVVITEDLVYTCGHGQGGRLGIGNEQTALKPKRVLFNDNNIESYYPCISASISRDHSIFLTEYDDRRQVWTCGLNTNYVLGINPPPEKQVYPRRLNSIKTQNIKGVSTGPYHSIAWTSNAVYSWGLNGGQLGHDASLEYVIVPKVVTKLRVKSALLEVTASIASTVILTKLGEILIFYQHKCIAIPTRGPLKKICAIGGKLTIPSESKTSNELKIAALTPNGKILIWYESDPTLIQCVMSLNREIIINDFAFSINGIAFITTLGECFTGVVKQRKKDLSPQNKQIAFNQFLERDKCHYIKLSKVPNLYRCVSIACDPTGVNFAVVQCNPKDDSEDDDFRSFFISDFKHLLIESQVDDLVHDIIFNVGSKQIPAHKYILFNSCKSIHTNLDNVRPEIFQELLMWIYTGSCELSSIGECPSHLMSKQGEKNPVRCLQELAKKFGVVDLDKVLSTLTMNGKRIHYVKRNKNYEYECFIRKFHRLDFPELHDLKIVAKNGRILPAHKCVLFARSQFFRNVYSNRWSISDKIDLPYTYNILELFLEFIYTDIFKLNVDVDALCHLLQLSDQYLIDNLRDTCQNELCYRLSFKNSVELLAVATAFNAHELKRRTMEFICTNLPTFLDMKLLYDLDDDLLTDLTKFYCSSIKTMQNRIITPFSTAPSDEQVLSIVENCPFETDGTKVKTTPRSHRTRHRSHKDSITENVDLISTSPKIETVIPESKEIEINIPPRIKAITEAQEKIAREKVEGDFIKLGSDRNFMGFDEFPILGTSPPGNKTPKITGEKRQKIKHGKEKKILFGKKLENKTSPTNPWKINVATVADVNIENQNKVANMQTIVMEEIKQKEKFNRMISKPLMYTQIEDKALEDLMKFYNCTNVFDEVITMERVSNQDIGVHPTWTKTHKML